MSKSFGIAFLLLGVWGIHNYDINSNSRCYEIVKVGKPLNADVMLDKCKGRTWTLVSTEASLSEFGYFAEDGEEHDIETLVWTRIHRGQGMLSMGEPE